MTWTKLGDEFGDEARDLTDAEYRTHTEALMWSNRRLLDLDVPKNDVRRFAESEDAEAAVAGLTAKGWWEDRRDTWYIGVHHPEWQSDGVVAKKHRDGSALRVRRSRLHKTGDHSICLPVNCPGASGPGAAAVDVTALYQWPGAGVDDVGLDTALYRWFDAADVLLYTGISDRLQDRLRGHISKSSWIQFAVRSTIERLPDRPDAAKAEREAIITEHPVFNKVHNDTPEARQRAVEYLINHGRYDLLVPAISRG